MICSVLIMLLMCMCSGLTVWHWTPAVCFSLGKATSPAFSMFQLLMVLCVVLTPCGIVPVQFDIRNSLKDKMECPFSVF